MAVPLTIRVVLDTNVLVATFRSKRGASFRLVSMLGDQRWQATISVALILEYEAIGKRECRSLGIPDSVAEDVIDMICAKGRQSAVYYRWRPCLPDPEDEFILEVAVSGQ